MFKTRLLQAYPPMMGLEMARLVGLALEGWSVPRAHEARAMEALKVDDDGLPELSGDGSDRVVNPGSARRLPEVSVPCIGLDCMAPDLTEPFVLDGNGAPKGLSPMEHVEWSCMQPHTSGSIDPRVVPALMDAVAYEIDSDIAEIDAFRQSIIDEWLRVADELEDQRSKVLDTVPLSIRTVVEKLHLPFIAYLIGKLDDNAGTWSDKNLYDCLHSGFSLVGLLQPSVNGVGSDMPRAPDLTLEEFVEKREE